MRKDYTLQKSSAYLVVTCILATLGSCAPAKVTYPTRCTGNGGSDKFVLAENYSMADPPMSPQRVSLNFIIHEIVSIDDLRNELELQGYLTLKWNETRLALTVAPDAKGEVYLHSRCIEVLWTPDVWIQGLVKFDRQQVMGDLAKLKVRNEHEIDYWQSVTIRVSCPMDLDKYPLDTQRCELRFSSNGLQKDVQMFSGMISFSGQSHLLRNALQYNVTLIKDEENAYHTESCPNEEPCWPQVAAHFVLDRYFKNHALQVFIPTGCLVALSWISFLIPPYIVPGRMVLLVTLLLVLFGSFATDQGDTPQSKGVKVQDIWFISCIIFILAAILEYALCLFLKRNITRQKRKAIIKKNKKNEGNIHKLFFNRNTAVDSKLPFKTLSPTTPQKCSPCQDQPSSVTNEQIMDVLVNDRPATKKNRTIDRTNSYGDVYDTNMEGEEMLENIDYASLKIFPSLFILYLIIFWATFLVKERKE